MLKNKQLVNKRFSWIIIVVILFMIGFVCSIPFIFYGNLYQQHDYRFHISRLEAYTESVKTLDFFPKIFYSYGNGGGYAVDMFYPSILLLPYALLRIVGLTAEHAFALFQLLLNFLIALSSFSLGYYLFKRVRPGLMVSLFYTASTYRFHDEIIRGALGEVFGLLFIPIAFIGLHSILFGTKKQWYWLVIGMSLLLISHLLSAFMLFFFILFFSIVQILIKRNGRDFLKRFSMVCLAGFWTLVLVLWQLLPMLQQSRHMTFNFSETKLSVPDSSIMKVVKDSFLANLGNPAAPNNNVGTFFIVALVLLWVFFIKLDRFSKWGVIFISCLLYLTSSSFPWNLLKDTPIKMIQFPFRFNAFCTLFLAIMITYVLKKSLRGNRVVLTIAIISYSFLSLNLSYSFQPTFIDSDHLSDFYTHPHSFGGGQEYIKIGETYDSVVPKNDTDIELYGKQALAD